MSDKQSSINNKICFVVAYFGKFPSWFPAFLLSCEKNPSIDWIILTDIKELPNVVPDNVKFPPIEMGEFIDNVKEILSTEINIGHPHKLCDYKPLYGDIFSKVIANYDYWGHCDIDLIWGDIEGFLQKISYQQYDIISTRQQTVCGHFTLYRNIEALNKFYDQVGNYKKIFAQPNYSGFDEGFFSYELYEQSIKPEFPYKVFWPKKYCVDWPELDVRPNGWEWKQGKIFDKNGNERVYLHFMKWKKSSKKIDFTYGEYPSSFKINRLGIWAGKMDFSSKFNYWLPLHFGNVMKHYWFKVIGFTKHKILKIPHPSGPIIPAGYTKM